MTVENYYIFFPFLAQKIVLLNRQTNVIEMSHTDTHAHRLDFKQILCCLYIDTAPYL